MREWHMERRLRFWGTTFVSLLLILGMHAVFPGMTLWRWYNVYFAYLFPLLLCAYVSVEAGQRITFGCRFISGLIQSSTLPVIFHSNRTAFRDPWEVTSEWLLAVICYAVMFALTTHLLAVRRQAWLARRQRLANRCLYCDYDLTGNVSGVCPECGTDIRQ